MPSPGALTAPPIRLLTLEHAGRLWRVSSRVCDVPDATAGRTHHYRGGMAAADVYLEASFLEVSEAPTVPVEVLVDGDLAALLADGHQLSELRAELALYREGDDYAARLVLVRGRAEVEGGGHLGQPLRLSLVGDSPTKSSGTWPPMEATISVETWGGNYDPLVDGTVYPQIIGHAGYLTGAAWGSCVAATPAYSVHFNTGAYLIRESPFGDSAAWQPGGFWPPGTGPDPDGYFLLISDGWMYPGAVGATNRGRIYCGKDVGGSLSWQEMSLVYAVDQLGRIVTLADMVGGVWIPDPGFSYYVCASPPVGGVARPDYRGALTGAGEVIRWALTQSAIRVDWRRTVPALARLNRYRVAGFWDQSCDAWGWVADNVLPLIPATWIPGPEGVYPVCWRLEATAESADLDLTDGLTCTIEGEPRHETGDIHSRLILDYAHDLLTSSYSLRATIHGSPPARTRREAMTPALRRAQQRHGSARGGQALTLDSTETTDVVYDDSTAWLVQGWRSRVYSGGRLLLRVVAPHYSRIAAAEPGMVVALTSARYSLSSRVFHVTRAGWLGGLCYADLVALES